MFHTGWNTDTGVDGIGLSDVVFPAFLFIVGLSLPYAINNRRNKGDTDWQIVNAYPAKDNGTSGNGRISLLTERPTMKRLPVWQNIITAFFAASPLY